MASSRRHASAGPRQRVGGFTLIELMIVVLIIGILASIAVPQYNEFVRRSRIVDATSAMNDYRTRMEQFYQDNRSYANAGACGVDPGTTGSGAFTLACINPTNTGYQLDAEGDAAKGMGGFKYRLTVAAGGTTRTTEDVPATWLPKAVGCWQVRKGGYCQ